MEKILSAKPLKIEEIKFKLSILFNLDISLTRIKAILLDFTMFKRINVLNIPYLTLNILYFPEILKMI